MTAWIKRNLELEGHVEVNPADIEELLFLRKLESHAEAGKMQTQAEAEAAFLELGGSNFEIASTILYKVMLKYFQRTDPFDLMVKTYEVQQDKMMEELRKTAKSDMARLQGHMREDVERNTKEIVKTIQGEYAAKHNELLELRRTHNKLLLQHTLLNSDYELIQGNFYDSSGISLSEQYQSHSD